MKVRQSFKSRQVHSTLSRLPGEPLARLTGYARSQVLHEHGFPVPQPIDQSRHCLIMELIDAFPL